MNLYLDVVAALRDTEFTNIPVYTGRYGLGSKDTTPAQIIAVFKKHRKEEFTICINDDVINLSLTLDETLTQLRQVSQAVSSGVLVQTVQSALTKTLLRLSVTTQI